MTKKNRGRMNEQIEAKSQEVFGLVITQMELRLMPYIQYVMVNEQRLEPNKINSDERRILQSWRERGWIEGGASGLSITKEFWDGMLEMIWLGYVCGEAKDAENTVSEMLGA